MTEGAEEQRGEGGGHPIPAAPTPAAHAPLTARGPVRPEAAAGAWFWLCQRLFLAGCIGCAVAAPVAGSSLLVHAASCMPLAALVIAVWAGVSGKLAPLRTSSRRSFALLCFALACVPASALHTRDTLIPLLGVAACIALAWPILAPRMDFGDEELRLEFREVAAKLWLPVLVVLSISTGPIAMLTAAARAAEAAARIRDLADWSGIAFSSVAASGSYRPPIYFPSPVDADLRGALACVAVALLWRHRHDIRNAALRGIALLLLLAPSLISAGLRFMPRDLSFWPRYVVLQEQWSPTELWILQEFTPMYRRVVLLAGPLGSAEPLLVLLLVYLVLGRRRVPLWASALGGAWVFASVASRFTDLQTFLCTREIPVTRLALTLASAVALAVTWFSAARIAARRSADPAGSESEPRSRGFAVVVLGLPIAVCAAIFLLGSFARIATNLPLVALSLQGMTLSPPRATLPPDVRRASAWLVNNDPDGLLSMPQLYNPFARPSPQSGGAPKTPPQDASAPRTYRTERQEQTTSAALTISRWMEARARAEYAAVPPVSVPLVDDLHPEALGTVVRTTNAMFRYATLSMGASSAKQHDDTLSLTMAIELGSLMRPRYAHWVGRGPTANIYSRELISIRIKSVLQAKDPARQSAEIDRMLQFLDTFEHYDMPRGAISPDLSCLNRLPRPTQMLLAASATLFSHRNSLQQSVLNHVRFRMSRANLLVLRYRERHGEWPTSLADLSSVDTEVGRRAWAECQEALPGMRFQDGLEFRVGVQDQLGDSTNSLLLCWIPPEGIARDLLLDSSRSVGGRNLLSQSIGDGFFSYDPATRQVRFRQNRTNQWPLLPEGLGTPPAVGAAANRGATARVPGRSGS